MMYFAELDIPLAPRERKELAGMERQRRAGKEVSPYPGYDTYSKLRARYDRPAALKRYTAEIEALTFGEVVTAKFLTERKEGLFAGGMAWRPMAFLQQFNLCAKKQEYDALKAAWLRAGLLDYSQDAQRHLDQQTAQEAHRIEQISDPAQHGGDPERAAISQGFTRRLFAAYRQYVEADIASLTTPVDTTDTPHLESTGAPPLASINEASAASQLSRLRLPQLALYHIYSGLHIRDLAHANELAEFVGMKSGERLIKKYNLWSTTLNRTNIDKPAVLRPFIENVKAVIPLLAAENRERAERELQGLEDKLRTSLD